MGSGAPGKAQGRQGGGEDVHGFSLGRLTSVCVFGSKVGCGSDHRTELLVQSYSRALAKRGILRFRLSRKDHRKGVPGVGVLSGPRLLPGGSEGLIKLSEQLQRRVLSFVESPGPGPRAVSSHAIRTRLLPLISTSFQNSRTKSILEVTLMVAEASGPALVLALPLHRLAPVRAASRQPSTARCPPPVTTPRPQGSQAPVSPF